MTDSTPIVVIIDDSRSVVALFKHSVESLDIDLHVFESAPQAQVWLETNRPDLIFLDIIMPEKDGLTYLKELRKTALHAETPVIMISSKDYAQDRSMARELGALEFVSKPVRAQVLRELVIQHTGAVAKSD